MDNEKLHAGYIDIEYRLLPKFMTLHNNRHKNTINNIFF